MASISTPFPLTSSTTSYDASRIRSVAVLNDCNQLVVSTDRVGVAIHNIAPNRIVKDYSVGPDVDRFLCAPVCIRSDTETTRTWMVYDEKDDRKLLCWTQTGVESSSDIIELPSEKCNIRSLLQIDDSGESILVAYSDSRVHCYKRGNSDAQWTSEIPGSPSYLRTFKATDSPLTQKLQGFVLLAISQESRIYTISPDAPPTSTAISCPTNDPSKTSRTAVDMHSGTIFQLAKRTLCIFKPNQEPTFYRLTNKFDSIHPLSASHVLLSSGKEIVIYDAVYGIIQSRLEIPNSHTTIINTSNPSSFYAFAISDSQALLFPVTIPSSSTLLDAIGKEHTTSLSTTNLPVLLAPKRKISSKEATKAVKELFESLKTISAAQDSKAFDKRFKEFRKSYKANRGEDKKMTKLTPLFVKELLSLIFVNGFDGLSIQVYAEKSLDFLLRVGLFSKDLLPGGAEQLVPVALGNPKFLNQLLKSEPTPFTYGDYLVLVKHILDTVDSQPAVPPDTILESFERDVDTFFDRPDIKTVLSNDQLQQFLQFLTRNPETVSYPSLFAIVLDAIGLGPLLLTQSLPTELFETLQSALDIESKSIAKCLETSAALSLILHRQNDIPLSTQRGRELLYGDRKRKVGQTGWVQMIAEEGGTKKRNNWMKKATLPGSGVALTSRFVAVAKSQEAPVYSLDRMIL